MRDERRLMTCDLTDLINLTDLIDLTDPTDLTTCQPDDPRPPVAVG